MARHDAKTVRGDAPPAAERVPRRSGRTRTADSGARTPAVRGSLFHTKNGDFDPQHSLVILFAFVGIFGFLREVWLNGMASGPAWAWLGGGAGGVIVGGGMHAFARAKRKYVDPEGEVET